MGYWNSRGLRGSGLEELINFTNEMYRQKGIALIQKIPTPITPVEISKEKRTITLAYFDQQSTVDYIGVAQGVPICFDAKETGQKSLPIQNIHEHQIKFMEDFEAQRGVAFLLVHFSFCDQFYLLPVDTLKKYWYAAESGGRKSIPFKAFESQYLISCKCGSIINYLDTVNQYLNNRESK